MTISVSLKTLLFTAGLLISAGTGSRLAAQTPVNDTPITTFQPIASPLPVNLITRSYSGTATQTTAEGTATTGTFTLTVVKGGSLSATTMFNGVSTTYDGSLPRVSSGGIKGTRAGFLLKTIAVATNVDGSVNYVAIFVPLLVDRSTASGGIQNADGSALTFHAERDAHIVGGN